MPGRSLSHHFERLNAPQIRADRATDRIYSWSLIAGLAFAALCIGAALTMGVE